MLGYEQMGRHRYFSSSIFVYRTATLNMVLRSNTRRSKTTALIQCFSCLSLSPLRRGVGLIIDIPFHVLGEIRCRSETTIVWAFVKKKSNMLHKGITPWIYLWWIGAIKSVVQRSSIIIRVSCTQYCNCSTRWWHS